MLPQDIGHDGGTREQHRGCSRIRSYSIFWSASTSQELLRSERNCTTLQLEWEPLLPLHDPLGRGALHLRVEEPLSPTLVTPCVRMPCIREAMPRDLVPGECHLVTSGPQTETQPRGNRKGGKLQSKSPQGAKLSDPPRTSLQRFSRSRRGD